MGQKGYLFFSFSLLSLPLETGKQRKDDEWMDDGVYLCVL